MVQSTTRDISQKPVLNPVAGPGAANENNDGVAAGAGGSQKEGIFTIVQVD